MISDDELKSAAKTALEIGLACAAERPTVDVLAMLRAAPVVAAKINTEANPYDHLSVLTRAEIAEYLDRAGWDPDKAQALAAAELAVDFGLSLTSRHLQVLAELIDNAPERIRVDLRLQMLDLLTRWLLRKRRVLGPDGRIVVGVRKWEEAQRIVAEWISDLSPTRPDSNPKEPVPDEARPRRTGTSAVSLRSSRQERPVDARKELIAKLKARNPTAKARKICELIDRNTATAPIFREALSALKPWQTKAAGKRLWVELYDDRRTRNQVRTYINKVPALQTAPKSSK